MYFVRIVNGNSQGGFMSRWTFITNHGAVLILISRYGEVTTRALAEELGITERSVIRIIKDLERESYILKKRVGRVNQYQINRNAYLRRKEVRDVAVGDLLGILTLDD
jgi:predicted transcriptional regulator